MVTKPTARKTELLVEKMGDETIVYDLEKDMAYCLNRTAAFVWGRCDGKATVAQLTAALKAELGAGADEDVVWLALGQLQKARLLETPVSPPRGRAPSRREVLRNLRLAGAAAILLPLVTGTLVPAPAYAFTCKVAGNSCSSTFECCPGLFCDPTRGNTCQPL